METIPASYGRRLGRERVRNLAQEYLGSAFHLFSDIPILLPPQPTPRWRPWNLPIMTQGDKLKFGKGGGHLLPDTSLTSLLSRSPSWLLASQRTVTCWGLKKVTWLVAWLLLRATVTLVLMLSSSGSSTSGRHRVVWLLHLPVGWIGVEKTRLGLVTHPPHTPPPHCSLRNTSPVLARLTWACCHSCTTVWWGSGPPQLHKSPSVSSQGGGGPSGL